MQRMATRLERAGAGLERHFPALPSGGGLVLLRHSYALILGLWQLSASCAGAGAANGAGDRLAAFQWAYPDELDRALRALWAGVAGAPPARCAS
jgi:hypothetical protein